MAARSTKEITETRQALLGAVNQMGPATAGELFTHLGLRLSPARVRDLSKAAPVFCTKIDSTAIAAVAFVGKPGEEQAALESPGIIHAVLQLPVVKKHMTRAHTEAQLRGLVPAAHQKAFGQVLKRRFAENDWPPTVGTVRGRSGPLVFLLEHVLAATPMRTPQVRGHGLIHSASLQVNGVPDVPFTSGAPARMDLNHFAEAFEAAFGDLVSRSRSRLVELADMRAALPSYTYQQFDRGLRRLRETSDRYVLQSFDGRHGRLRPEALQAAIREAGRTYVYVTRRDL